MNGKLALLPLAVIHGPVVGRKRSLQAKRKEWLQLPELQAGPGPGMLAGGRGLVGVFLGLVGWPC